MVTIDSNLKTEQQSFHRSSTDIRGNGSQIFRLKAYQNIRGPIIWKCRKEQFCVLCSRNDAKKEEVKRTKEQTNLRTLSPQRQVVFQR